MSDYIVKAPGILIGMIKLGIKVGPQQDSFSDLDATKAPFCEVWYNATKPDDYTELFDGLKKRAIETGLHYWGALSDGTWTNFAYPDAELITTTLDLMKHTIDTAARHNCVYVNIHPGTAAKVHIDFEAQAFKLLSEPVPMHEAQALFLEHAHALHDYATKRGIILTIETVPLMDMNGWYDGPSGRDNPMNIHELPVSTHMEAASQGLWIANDFCHSAANTITDRADAVWTDLHALTKTLAAQTRLIHLGFIVPPYNGCDFHDHLDNPLLDTNQAIPNKQQMIELLKLFKHRTDMWMLVEPVADHVKNYHLAQKILETSQQ